MRFLHFLATALVAFGLTAGAVCAAPMSYSQIYAFGDSLSDVGNIYTLTDHNVPVSPPYSQGRFTNGKVWVQYLADDLGLGPVTASLTGGNDFAYGGAQTGATIAHEVEAIDLPSQLNQFQIQNPDPAGDALYTLWVGANDLNAFISKLLVGQLSLGDAGTFIGQATANVGDVVASLADDGMNHLLALNVPDLSKTPTVINAANQTDNPLAVLAQVQALTRAFNDALGNTLHGVAQANGVDLTLVDTFSRIQQIVAYPQDFGFSNVTDPCWTGNSFDAQSGAVCAHPDDYLFWDGIHPTRQGHRLVAEYALQALRADAMAVPAPGSGGLFLTGLLVVAAMLAWRRYCASRRNSGLLPMDTPVG